MAKRLLVWFNEVDKEDIPLVGGKGANLGEMTRADFPVPQGFILTSEAYREFIRENDLEIKIQHLLGLVDYDKEESLEKISKQIEHLIKGGKLSDKFIQEVFAAYDKLSGTLRNALVAVRSSATAEDLPSASFAGQQETYLNTKGEANLLLRIKDCWASLFHPRAIFYRHDQHIDSKTVAIAIPVQKMVESEVSGIMFSIDPLTNNKDVVVIEAVFGLGEMIVQGELTPDHYEVDKKNMTIVVKKIVKQEKMMVKKGNENEIIAVARSRQNEQKLEDKHILELASLSKRLEHHYYFPQDSEWAVEKNKVYLVQTRPITTIHAVEKNTPLHSTNSKELPIILKGDGASPGIATGTVKILRSAKEIDKIGTNDVLVAEQTNPDFVPGMKKAVAIVTDKGGRTSHAAIVSREIGIPAAVGTENATTTLKDGEIITVNGLTGEVYKGGVVGTKQHVISHASSVVTATKVYVNLAEPEFAADVALRHVDGVGLLRAEFMIAGIGIHPRKLIDEGKGKEFSEKLSEGLKNFAKSFTPRPVVYRASDFKTNEYRNLIGGKEYEPVESNPMLGFRGAYRYIHDSEVFHLELEAIKTVRNKYGMKNLWLMIPFVRTVKELEEIKGIIASAGLYRSPTFKIWMMVEIPSNVILLDKFIEQGIDGVSIGSNDLTMLTLGTDRDNSEVAKEFNEQDDAMLYSYEHIIKTAHKHGITASLCGQAASVYPTLLKHLVNWGITSVSVSPDAIDITREHIARFEKERVS